MAAPDRARARMLDALLRGGRIRSPAVQDAFRTVPRHLFLPDLPPAQAYADEAVAVQFTGGVATSSASQPSMMAIMLEQLDLRPGMRVLEIGAGTGYNAALMARILGRGDAVTAVDIDEDLVDLAAAHLAAAGVTGVELVAGDGAFGHPPGAPYDRIVFTVGSTDVRPEWVAQLAPGGRLLLPLAVRGSQLSAALDLGPDGVLRSASVRSCMFIRLRGAAAGAATTRPLPRARLVVEVPDDGARRVEPAEVDEALAEPGPVRPVGVALGPADVWDGFGLWLALAEPGVCRLAGADTDDERVGGPAGIGTAPGTLALAAAPGTPGLAAVVSDTLRAFGPAGPEQVERVVAALDGWVAAGRPGAAQLRLEVVGRTGAEEEPARPGTTVVGKELSYVLAGWAAGPARS